MALRLNTHRAASFLELLTLDTPRTDCPMTLPAVPTGVAQLDSPTLTQPAELNLIGQERVRSGDDDTTGLPALQCKQHSAANRPDDGECSRYEPTRRQLKNMAQFSRLSQTPMPDVATMTRDGAEEELRHRFGDWRRQQQNASGDGDYHENTSV
jgi:hypothetical protein